MPATMPAAVPVRPRDRAAKAAASALLALLAGCAGSGLRLPDQLLTATHRGPVDLQIRSSRITAAAMPIAVADLPPVIARHIASIQPGGEHLVVERLWDTGGQGYRATTRYPAGTPGARRQLVLDDAGTVVERSHEIPLAEVPGNVREAVRRRWDAGVTSADVVLHRDGRETFRLHLRDADGRQGTVDCSPAGVCSTPVHVLQATLHVTGPAP